MRKIVKCRYKKKTLQQLEGYCILISRFQKDYLLVQLLRMGWTNALSSVQRETSRCFRHAGPWSPHHTGMRCRDCAGCGLARPAQLLPVMQTILSTCIVTLLQTLPRYRLHNLRENTSVLFALMHRAREGM
jgi:hypothetical protein